MIENTSNLVETVQNDIISDTLKESEPIKSVFVEDDSTSDMELQLGEIYYSD